MSFFKPVAWQNTADALNFKSAKKVTAAPVVKKDAAALVKKGRVEKKKQKVQQKQKTKLAKVANLPRLPKQLQSDDDDDDDNDNKSSDDSNSDNGNLHSAARSKQKVIQNGRIEKQKLKNATKLNQNKLKQAAKASAVANEMTLKTPANAPADHALNAYQLKLKNELVGGRFRFINEQLYTMNSAQAVELFSKDKDAYNAYHEGFRHQAEQWPFNPLKRIIKMIKRLPKTYEIGDFGCGDGELAQSVMNKVYSMDLVSSRDDIIACDMAKTPLKNESLDLAVYCLSLMGTNLKDFMLEANRVLKVHGLLYIAEIQTRFENEQEFVRGLQSCGFQLIKKELTAKLFLLFQFKKTQNVGKIAIIKPFALKPCLYRKR